LLDILILLFKLKCAETLLTACIYREVQSNLNMIVVYDLTMVSHSNWILWNWKHVNFCLMIFGSCHS